MNTLPQINLSLIHKTHSKRDIIEIIELLNIPIEDPNDLNKHQLQTKLLKYCNDNSTTMYLPNHLFITSMEDLKVHLKNLNQRKISGTDTRANVMKKAKKLTQYSKAGYMYFERGYMYLDDIIEDIEYILPFGDYPSVRKSIANINNDPKLKNKYFPVISHKEQVRIKEKQEAKYQKAGCAVVKKGKWVLYFD